MSSQVQRLTQLFHDTRDSKGYSNTSKWYDGLSKAISFLKRAEADHDPFDRFWNAWSSVYNLFTQYGKPGDEEFKMINSWVSDIQEIPAVRNIFDLHGGPIDIPELLNKIKAVRRNLLKAQGEQALTAWKPGVTVSAKACRYFFNIVQDVRNRKAHPDFNPSNPKVRKALTALADCLIPIATEAIEVMIERPVPGTTGRVPIKHFFLWPFLNNADGFFSDYYLERLFPDEELATFPEDDAKPKLKELRKAFRDKREELNAADIQETTKLWCEPVLFPLLNTTPVGGISLVGEGIVQPAFVMAKSGSAGILKKEYYGKETAEHIACLIWVLPWAASLDAILEDTTGTLLPALEMANRTLTISDVPWAVLTNGRQLRLLSRQTAHKPRCFLEINLEATCDITRDQEECLKAFRYSLGLFSGDGFTEEDDKGTTRLERIRVGSERHGKEIGDELKQNVFNALEELGDGFLHYLKARPDKLRAWCEEKGVSGTLDECLLSEALLGDIYHESLSLMYRLLFLFYAESRNLLPLDNEIYQTYSLESIRDEIISVHDDPDPRHFFSKGESFLWDQLQQLFKLVNEGKDEIVHAYNGGLFDPEVHPFLERFRAPDYFLARAIDFLSRTQPSFSQGRGEGRKKVTYRDLDVRHLGSIYEGILEYNARIADDDLAVVKRGTGNKLQEEYVPVGELKGKEKEDLAVYLHAVEDDPDSPKLPRSIKVTGLKEKGSYFLVYGGRDSKRKSSGSYYTPDYIVQYIVDNTLGPLVRGGCRPQPKPLPEELKKIGIREEKPIEGPLSSEEILQLKVLDPAMGSGHFLVAATEYLALAYKEACIREGKHEHEHGVVAEEEFVRYKRIVAERCIYGVDINPMAVELAKLSLWLTTMDSGRPLSFLDNHLKCGNSLIGTWLDDFVEQPGFESLKPLGVQKGEKIFVQKNAFIEKFKALLPTMMKDVLSITELETLEPRDIRTKKALDQAVEALKLPFKRVANAYFSPIFGGGTEEYYLLLTKPGSEAASRSISMQLPQKVFHWWLEFPEVFFDSARIHRGLSGWDAIFTNPPYVNAQRVSPEIRPFLYKRYDTVAEKSDMYCAFLELALFLVNCRGRIGFITSNTWLANVSFLPLRRKLIARNMVESFATPPVNAFESATVSTVITIISVTDQVHQFIATYGLTSEGTETLNRFGYGQVLQSPQFVFNPLWTSEQLALVAALASKQKTMLGNVYEVVRGAVTGDDSKWLVRQKTEKYDKKVLTGSDIEKYKIKWPGLYLRYLPEEIYKHRGTARPGTASRFEQPIKIILPGRGGEVWAAVDTNSLYAIGTCNIILLKEDSPISLWALAAILNSSLVSRWYEAMFPAATVTMNELRLIPLPFADKQDVMCSDMHEIISRLEELCKRRSDDRLSIDEAIALDAEIDALVYGIWKTGVM